MAGYVRLKRDLAGGKGDDILEMFEANASQDLNKAYELIAKLTRRDVITVKSSANALFAPPAFASEKPLWRHD